MKKLWILGVLALLPVVAHADRRQERVANQVQRRMDNAPALSGYRFNVQTVGRYLQLRGTVRTETQRQRAGQIARRNSQGYPIRNLIVVNPVVRR